MHRPAFPALRRGLTALSVALALVSGSATVRAQAPASAPSPSAPDAPLFSVRVVGRGAPMLLIPGLTNGGAVWDATVDSLKRDYQLHVFTLAGFAGQAPVAIDSTWLTRMRDGIITYAQQQRLRTPVIVGHSLGGFLALAIAAHAPTLPGSVVNIDGLPFLGATQNPAATVATARPQAQAMRRMMVGPNGTGGNIAIFAKMQEAQLRSMIRDTAMIPVAAEMARTSDLRTIAEAMYALYTTDLRDSLGTVRAPVLNLHAWVAYQGYGMTRPRADSLFAAQYRTLRTGTTRVSDTSYHFIMYDEPAWMLREMRAFLQSQRQ